MRRGVARETITISLRNSERPEKYNLYHPHVGPLERRVGTSHSAMLPSFNTNLGLDHGAKGVDQVLVKHNASSTPDFLAWWVMTKKFKPSLMSPLQPLLGPPPTPLSSVAPH